MGDYFIVEPIDKNFIKKNSNKSILGPYLYFQGNLTKYDAVGSGMSEGTLFVNGDVGDYLGVSMTNGFILVTGSAGIHAGCEMAGGNLHISKNIGDFGASALPGKMQGVTGGTFIVDGDVGDNFGTAMRRGLSIISGNSGKNFGSRMLAGTIVLAGSTGDNCGFGMKRGSIIFLKVKPNIPSTFQQADYNFDSFWNFLTKSLEKNGQISSSISKKRVSRVVGDLAFGGKGEWLIVN